MGVELLWGVAPRRTTTLESLGTWRSRARIAAGTPPISQLLTDNLYLRALQARCSYSYEVNF